MKKHEILTDGSVFGWKPVLSMVPQGSAMGASSRHNLMSVSEILFIFSKITKYSQDIFRNNINNNNKANLESSKTSNAVLRRCTIKI